MPECTANTSDVLPIPARQAVASVGGSICGLCLGQFLLSEAFCVKHSIMVAALLCLIGSLSAPGYAVALHNSARVLAAACRNTCCSWCRTQYRDSGAVGMCVAGAVTALLLPCVCPLTTHRSTSEGSDQAICGLWGGAGRVRHQQWCAGPITCFTPL
jgi:hypothetical protein